MACNESWLFAQRGAIKNRSRITRYTEVGRSGGGGARIILPGETEAALRERSHDLAKSGGLFEAMNGDDGFTSAILNEITPDL